MDFPVVNRPAIRTLKVVSFICGYFHRPGGTFEQFYLVGKTLLHITFRGGKSAGPPVLAEGSSRGICSLSQPFKTLPALNAAVPACPIAETERRPISNINTGSIKASFAYILYYFHSRVVKRFKAPAHLFNVEFPFAQALFLHLEQFNRLFKTHIGRFPVSRKTRTLFFSVSKAGRWVCL